MRDATNLIGRDGQYIVASCMQTDRVDRLTMSANSELGLCLADTPYFNSRVSTSRDAEWLAWMIDNAGHLLRVAFQYRHHLFRLFVKHRRILVVAS